MHVPYAPLPAVVCNVKQRSQIGKHDKQVIVGFLSRMSHTEWRGDVPVTHLPVTDSKAKGHTASYTDVKGNTLRNAKSQT